MEDTLYKFLGLYKKSPPWVKRTVGECYGLLPYSIRYGKKFNYYKQLAIESKQWSHKQHEDYQCEKLSKLLRHAYEHVPYYRSKYDDAKVSPDDFKVIDDIKLFPPITREEIKTNMPLMLADNISEDERLYTATSGSSGVPLELFHHKGITRPKERAFLHDLFNEFGYRKGQKIVVFRGEIINDEETPWYYDPVDSNLIMSSYRLSEKTIAGYCRRIRSLRPSVIRGYPFIVFKLVQLMKLAGEKPFELECVILESENIYETQRKTISDYFNCPVCHYYGHTERLVFGGNCRLNDEYHLHPEYGYVEVVNDKHGHVADGEQGEILSTGFDNLVMPLIRYRTNDFAVRGADSCKCGRKFPMLKRIMGRAEEYVILDDSSKVPFHNLLAGIHSDTWGKAFKLQCVQENAGELSVNVVPNDGVDPHDALSAYLTEIEKRLDDGQLRLIGSIVNDIPATTSGKTKLFIQKIELF